MKVKAVVTDALLSERKGVSSVVVANILVDAIQCCVKPSPLLQIQLFCMCARPQDYSLFAF